jgi:hypothetical protein
VIEDTGRVDNHMRGRDAASIIQQGSQGSE